MVASLPEIVLNHLHYARSEKLDKVFHVVVLIKLSHQSQQPYHENVAIDVSAAVDQLQKRFSLLRDRRSIHAVVLVVFQQIFAESELVQMSDCENDEIR